MRVTQHDGDTIPHHTRRCPARLRRQRLGLGPVTVIGHSLGAVNAYQLAARRPDLVDRFVAIDFPVEARHYPDP
ncbi:alpha/beta fold hydrolase [Nonomuraea insulae]|uniref:Alpha/beta fold hydrolase n=1 Tax=Nonomuraea insulae TaxID=1616787 RepID=A0ABW1CN66_9ACTN